MADENNHHHTEKPLAHKSDAELKRETKARLEHMSPDATKEVFDEVMGAVVVEPWTGFVNFLREKAVVGLAVGFIIGTQAQAWINSVYKNIIQPMINVILPQDSKLSKWSFTVGSGDDQTLHFGGVINATLSFLFFMIILYLMIRLLHLDKLDKKK